MGTKERPTARGKNRTARTTSTGSEIQKVTPSYICSHSNRHTWIADTENHQAPVLRHEDGGRLRRRDKRPSDQEPGDVRVARIDTRRILKHRLNLVHPKKAQVDLFFSSRRRHTRFDCDWSSDVCSSD